MAKSLMKNGRFGKGEDWGVWRGLAKFVQPSIQHGKQKCFGFRRTVGFIDLGASLKSVAGFHP